MTPDERDDVNAYRRAWYAAHRKHNTATYRQILARQKRYEATHKPPTVWWKRERP